MAEPERTLYSWQHLANRSGPSSEPCPQSTGVPSQQGSINIAQRQSSQIKNSSIASHLGQDGKEGSPSSTNTIPGTPTQLDLGTPAKWQRYGGEFPSTSPNSSGTPPTPPDDKNTSQEEYPSEGKSADQPEHSKLCSQYVIGSQVAEELPWFLFVEDPMTEYMQDMETIGHAYSPAPPLPQNRFAFK